MGPQDPRLSSPAERERSAAKDRGTWGQYVVVCSVSNSPLTHNPFATISIKWERYIFLKKCVRSSLLTMFPRVYVYSSICIMAVTMQHDGNEGVLHITLSSSIMGLFNVISMTLLSGMGFFPLCRDAVAVFYNTSRLGCKKIKSSLKYIF